MFALVLCLFLVFFGHSPFFVLFLEHMFVHGFSSLIVLFECISFVEILFDLTTALFLLSPFTFFLSKNKQNHLFLNCFSFLLSFEQKNCVSLLFLLFFSKGEPSQSNSDHGRKSVATHYSDAGGFPVKPKLMDYVHIPHKWK